MREKIDERLVKAVNELDNITNNIGCDPTQRGRELSQAIQHKHRTIQQSIVSLLLNALLDYRNASSDGRNQYSVEICQEIFDFLEERGKVYKDQAHFPFI